jgi:hypothetical protein
MTFLVGVFSSASAETSDPVAKLYQIEGQVLVNTGTAYVAAQPGMEIKPGTKILTRKDSSVNVSYNDGCIKRLNENSMLTVNSATECTAGLAFERVYVADMPSAHALRSEMAIAVWGGALGAAVMYNPSHDKNPKNVSAE